jgi:flagellin-like protein
MKKKGISPVIATVLLIAMVIVIGLLIFLWAKSFQEEAITKFGGENVKLSCGKVTFEADYSISEKKLFILNLGNVPIFEIKAKIYRDGSHETKDLGELSDWPEIGLPQGATFSENVDSSFLGAERVVLIPALRGSSGGGERVHICDDQIGEEIQV